MPEAPVYVDRYSGRAEYEVGPPSQTWQRDDVNSKAESTAMQLRAEMLLRSRISALCGKHPTERRR
jgi:hypothetical protein